MLWVVTLLGGDLEVISGCQGKVLSKFRRPFPLINSHNATESQDDSTVVGRPTQALCVGPGKIWEQ
mgnify:CR=1 FL=1